jgi:hypothetical protein
MSASVSPTPPSALRGSGSPDAATAQRRKRRVTIVDAGVLRDASADDVERPHQPPPRLPSNDENEHEGDLANAPRPNRALSAPPAGGMARADAEPVAATDHEERKEDGEGDGGPPADPDADEADEAERIALLKKKKTKGHRKQHPLATLPLEPWRAAVRAIFFPMVQREFLIWQDLPVPEKEPIVGDWFENLMTLFIGFNIILLALFDPWADESATTYALIATGQVVITIAFQVELTLRVVALGYKRMLTVLRLVDALIVVACTVSLIVQFSGTPNRYFGLSVLRSPRLFRPFKNLGAFPSLVILVEAVSECLFKIGDVTLIFFTFLTIFAVASIGMFGGALHNRCVNEQFLNLTAVQATYNYTSTDIGDYVCMAAFDTEVLGKRDGDMISCYAEQVCDNGAGQSFGIHGFLCPYGYRCLPFQNPVDGYVGFDQIAQSFLTLYVSSTQQMWFAVAGQAADATNDFAYWYFAFFLVFAVLILNLMIVIITVDFELAKSKAKKRMSDAANAGAGNISAFGGVVQELLRKSRAKKEAMEAKRRATDLEKERVSAAFYGESTGAPKRNVAEAIASTAIETSTKAVSRTREFAWNYVVDTRWFFWVSTAMILVNVLVLSYIHYGMRTSHREVCEMITFVLTISFSAETVLRLIAMPFPDFLSHRMNIFDAVLNVVAWLDIATDLASLRWLSSLRVIRTFKLLRISPGIHHWMKFIVSSIKSSPFVLVMLWFVILIFALIGMQLLGGHFCGLAPDSGDDARCVGRPLYNFDDFPHAMLTSFQLITGDDWNDILYVAIAAGGWPMGILFPLYFYLGNFILLSLFIGVLLSAHAEDEEKNNTEAALRAVMEATFSKTKKHAPKTKKSASTDDAAVESSGGEVGDREDRFQGWDAVDDAAEVEGVEVPETPHNTADIVLQNTAIALIGVLRATTDVLRVTTTTVDATMKLFGGATDEEVAAEEAAQEEDKTRAAAKEQKRIDKLAARLEAAQRGAIDDGDEHSDDDDAQSNEASFAQASFAHAKDGFGKLSGTVGDLADDVDGKMKSVLRPFVKHYATQFFMICVVVVASGAMALRNPIAAPDTTLASVCDIIETVATALYIAEAVVSILAFGLYESPASYLKRDRWNTFDLFIATCGLVSIVVKAFARNSVAYSLVHSILALRLLSLVKRNGNMNLVAKALAKSVIEMRFALAAILIVVFVFAIVGTQLFMGKFRSCVIDRIPVDALPRSNCTAVGGKWKNTTPNFDNVFESLFSLFIIMTLELWSILMYRAMAFDGDGNPPRPDGSVYSSLYFVLFAVVGGFMLVNIFMSVLVDCYNRSKRDVSAQKSLKQTREVNGWMGTNHRLIRALPPQSMQRLMAAHEAPSSPLRKMFANNFNRFQAKVAIDLSLAAHVEKSSSWLSDLARSQKFLNFCFFVVFVSFVLMAIEYHPSSAEYQRFLFIAQATITAWFCLEALIKIVGETLSQYWASKWNRFDLVVAVVSVAAVSLSSVLNPRMSSLLRAMRILRLASILKGKSSLNQLIHKFGVAIGSLGGVAAIVTIFFFMFAILAMEFFGRVVWQERGTSYIGHSSHFSSVGASIFMLLRITFGGDWMFVYWNVRLGTEGCLDRIGNCGPPMPIPQLFFVAFIGFSLFVLKNLLVAVLVDQFETAGDLRSMSKPQAKAFVEVWRRHDPLWTMKVSGFDVLSIVRALSRKSPLGFATLPQQKRVALELRMLMLLRIADPHEREDGVAFDTLVDLLCHMSYETMPPDDRGLRMTLPADVPDEQARLSSVLIVINLVARRLLHQRRKRLAKEHESNALRPLLPHEREDIERVLVESDFDSTDDDDVGGIPLTLNTGATPYSPAAAGTRAAFVQSPMTPDRRQSVDAPLSPLKASPAKASFQGRPGVVIDLATSSDDDSGGETDEELVEDEDRTLTDKIIRRSRKSFISATAWMGSFNKPAAHLANPDDDEASADVARSPRTRSPQSKSPQGKSPYRPRGATAAGDALRQPLLPAAAGSAVVATPPKRDPRRRAGTTVAPAEPNRRSGVTSPRRSAASTFDNFDTEMVPMQHPRRVISPLRFGGRQAASASPKHNTESPPPPSLGQNSAAGQNTPYSPAGSASRPQAAVAPAVDARSSTPATPSTIIAPPRRAVAASVDAADETSQNDSVVLSPIQQADMRKEI